MDQWTPGYTNEFAYQGVSRSARPADAGLRGSENLVFVSVMWLIISVNLRQSAVSFFACFILGVLLVCTFGCGLMVPGIMPKNLHKENSLLILPWRLGG